MRGKKSGPDKRMLIRLDVEPELHRALRVVAAEANVSMAEFARRAVAEAVRQAGRRGGKTS
jgi:predicted HicB family RNase H-like nuclease